MRTAAVATAAMAVILLSGGAKAASPQEVAVDVSRAVMSPFCPGVTLHDCTSPAAERLRMRIEQWARSGSTQTEILRRLEDEYSRAIRATPPATEFPAWLVPIGLTAIGMVTASVLARKWTREPESVAQPLSAPERARVREEATKLGFDA